MYPIFLASQMFGCGRRLLVHDQDWHETTIGFYSPRHVDEVGRCSVQRGCQIDFVMQRKDDSLLRTLHWADVDARMSSRERQRGMENLAGGLMDEKSSNPRRRSISMVHRFCKVKFRSSGSP